MLTEKLTDVVILDTETLGLDPDAPIWEFAAVRRFADGHTDSTEFFLLHDPGDWVETLDGSFLADYQARYDHRDALDDRSAAIMVNIITRGAKVIACNPGFDLERLTKLLTRNDIEPDWHYHPLDITSVAIGYAAGRDYRPPAGPWRSEQMSERIGVQVSKFARHSAMGDVQWTLAQWDMVMGGGAE